MAGMAPDPLSATRERLRRLEQLRTEGFVTDEEYAAKRAAIVDDVIAVPVSNAPHPVSGDLLRLPGSGCPSCGRDVLSDRRFCQWCTAFLIQPSPGTMAGLFRRWAATWLDVLVPVALIVASIAVTRNAGAVSLVVLGYAVWSLWAFGRGMTVGKLLLGLRVVRTDGSRPGFFTMLLREWIGKPLDGMFFGLGWFWAIFDRDRQAWHDKIAGTVVVRGRWHSAGSAGALLPPSPHVGATVGHPRSDPAKSYRRWASSRPRTWQRIAAFGAPALLAVVVVVAAIGTWKALAGGNSSTRAVPPIASAQDNASNTPPAGWNEIDTSGAQVWLPAGYVGGDVAVNGEETFARLRASGGAPYADAVRQMIANLNASSAPARLVLLAVDGTQPTTTLNIIRDDEPLLTLTADQYVDRGVELLPPSWKVLSRDSATLGRYRAARLFLKLAPAAGPVEEVQYTVKQGSTYWTLTYSAAQNDFDAQLPTFDASAHTLQVLVFESRGVAELNIVQTAVDAKLANTSSATTAAITTATSDMTTAPGGFGLAPTYLRSTATHGTYTVDSTGRVSQAAYP